MIELNADESMLLLLTKNWKYKKYPALRDFKGHFIKHDREQYIQACCNVRCFGANTKEHKASVYMVYAHLIEKLLSTRVLLRAYENSMKAWRNVTMFEEIIAELACLQIKDEIKLDYSDVVHDGFEHFIYSPEECEAIKRFNSGELPTYSTGICESLTCGYGELDNNGYWEFTLPERYWLYNDQA